MWGVDSIFDEKPKPRYELRSEPLTVSDRDFRPIFKLNDNYRPLEYIENDFEDNGETVIDHATGLMWQKSGSDFKYLEDVQEYVQELNKKRFVGYNDWRFPTIDELISLINPEKQSNNLHIDTIFDKKQRWCWSSDTRTFRGAFSLTFNGGKVHWTYEFSGRYVRAVRSQSGPSQVPPGQ